jgi:hypothetical protein
MLPSAEVIAVDAEDLRYPTGIAYNKEKQELYWTELNRLQIKHSHLNGSFERVIHDAG